MNAFLEFLLVAGTSFLFFMFIGYRDAVRSKAPKGIIASVFNQLSFWKAEDEEGIRGYLFRQNIILKLIVALAGAAIIRMIYAYFFDWGTTDGVFDIFTGITGYLLHALAILLGIFLAYQWPKVKSQMLNIKDSATKKNIEAKKENEPAKKIEKKSESPAEEVKELSKEVEPPKEDPKSNDPGDVIDDYLK